MKILLALLVLLLAVPGCQEEIWTVAPVKPDNHSEQKSPQVHQRQVPVMGNWQLRDIRVDEISGLCMNVDSTGLWAVGDGGVVCKVSFEGAVTPCLPTTRSIRSFTSRKHLIAISTTAGLKASPSTATAYCWWAARKMR